MTNLSVLILTKNEAHNIEECLKSVAFAQQIIVMDSGSTDSTVAICQQYTSDITITAGWPGDGPQKNLGLKQVVHDWVLCIDADERLSPELILEIQDTLQAPKHVAYDIPFQSSYCGKALRFGDWSNESHIRLFHQKNTVITMDMVHCKTIVHGSVGKLKNKMIHHPFRHLDRLLDKMNEYSSLGAHRLYQKGKKASLWTALSHSLWIFFRGYMLRLGFLDGREGFLLAVSNAQGTYYRYLKLMYLSETGAITPS